MSKMVTVQAKAFFQNTKIKYVAFILLTKSNKTKIRKEKYILLTATQKIL